MAAAAMAPVSLPRVLVSRGGGRQPAGDPGPALSADDASPPRVEVLLVAAHSQSPPPLARTAARRVERFAPVVSSSPAPRHRSFSSGKETAPILRPGRRRLQRTFQP